MNENKKIIPRKLSGFMELPPEKQIIFDSMKRKIEETFIANCFLPLDTPVLELSEILLAKSGGEIDKEVYRFKKGDTDICMRYDLTVPLARFVAMNSENLNFPFKRYQIGKSYRGEKAQKGRFREFYQCDADIIGNENLSLVADAECVNLFYKIFLKLNLDATVHVSNRNILFGYIEELKYENARSEILTILDKINKVGKNNALLSLLDLNISQVDSEKLIDLTQMVGDFNDIIPRIENLSKNETFLKGIDELKQLSLYLESFGTKKYVLDLGIIRGQDYYTGTIFETYLTEHPELGAVGAGGRYDNLAGYFTEKHLPGVGISIGLTRLFDSLDSHNMLCEKVEPSIEVMIIPLGDTLTHCLNITSYLRENNVKAELNYEDKSFKAKLKEANKREIPYVMIIGEDEVKNNQYAIKNMKESSQSTLTKEQCLQLIKSGK